MGADLLLCREGERNIQSSSRGSVLNTPEGGQLVTKEGQLVTTGVQCSLLVAKMPSQSADDAVVTASTISNGNNIRDGACNGGLVAECRKLIMLRELIQSRIDAET